ncbi:MAG: phospholipase [Bacteroidia bacterium]|nr:phospholipase [Bacteroidia bacterium]
MRDLFLVFIHGYSVTNTDTYGGLPQRLLNESQGRGFNARVEHIFLGRYISFNDEVRLDDVSRALESAVKEQIPGGTRFVCITHSTGGPVARNWWNNFYKDKASVCPMSHLIMLAPANYGSSLAQLGKTRLSRVKSWFDGVEPGQKILNWLELGSQGSWDLNLDWILNGEKHISEKEIFPFVITGQSIDRKLYDHINSYTGELGSDGVVRVASANLNSRYVKLRQADVIITSGTVSAPNLEPAGYFEAPKTAMRIVKHKSHSNADMGIMKSVKAETDDEQSKETVDAIFNCISVNTLEDYKNLCVAFDRETEEVLRDEKVEIEKKLLKKNIYIHDSFCMVIFRVRDSEGLPVPNFDLLLTSGPENDPDMLPNGFFADRQCNQSDNSVLTYYFNYDVMNGNVAIRKDGEEIRKELPGTDSLGFILRPRPDEGFVRYLPCSIKASKEIFETVLKPNSTTLIDIELKRVVSKELFRFESADPVKLADKNFKKTSPGDSIV